MIEALDRAAAEWEIVIRPFPLYGDTLFTLYFQHRQHPFRFLYRHFKSFREAQIAEKELTRDLNDLRVDKFREKYRIGYDIKGSLV